MTVPNYQLSQAVIDKGLNVGGTAALLPLSQAVGQVIERVHHHACLVGPLGHVAWRERPWGTLLLGRVGGQFLPNPLWNRRSACGANTSGIGIVVVAS